jgi:hypothetical protein
VIAYVPDLMDRSRLTAAIRDVRFVGSPAELAGSSGPGDVVVVDLGRPKVLDAIDGLTGRRVVGFGSHVERELLAAAKEAGCGEVLTRSAFFGGLPDLLA